MLAQGLHSPPGILVRTEYMNAELQKLWKTEDYSAVWLGLGIVSGLKLFGRLSSASRSIYPLGYFLSTVVFSKHWSDIPKMM